MTGTRRRGRGPAPGAAQRGRDVQRRGLRRDRAPSGIDVHFINRVRVKGTLARDRPPVTLTVSGAAAVPAVGPVDEDADWFTDTSGRPVLHVPADLPDGPARYRLTVHSGRLDPCLRSAVITRARRDARDCAPGDAEARRRPPRRAAGPGRLSRQGLHELPPALSEFSAARYPLWVKRSEADFGVMLMEVLSALADELSYLQDRVAAEATIGTATQRLSLVRHARLVDYEPTGRGGRDDRAAARSGARSMLALRGTVVPDVMEVRPSAAGHGDFAAGPVFELEVHGYRIRRNRHRGATLDRAGTVMTRRAACRNSSRTSGTPACLAAVGARRACAIGGHGPPSTRGSDCCSTARRASADRPVREIVGSPRAEDARIRSGAAAGHAHPLGGGPRRRT